MKDIKTLFLTAKRSRNEADISSYSEAVTEAMDNPLDYITHLEYIIKSNIGLKTLKPFIEKYGLPVACYDSIIELLTECIDKSDTGMELYESVINDMKDFRANHFNEFAMYGYYAPEDESEYIRTYYGSTNGNQNRKLLKGMINRFGEAAVPDLLITAESIGKRDYVIQQICENVGTSDALFCEWFKHLIPTNMKEYHIFDESSVSHIINAMKERNQRIYTEAMIMNDESAEMIYTEQELSALQDLISYKEYKLLWSEEFGTPVMEAQQEIYDLYEEYSGMIMEDVDNKDLKDDKDYVPIYVVLQSYSQSDTDNYGNKKSVIQKSLADIGKLITFMTKGDKYTHALISLDSDLKEMYSFGSLGFEKAPIEEDELWVTTQEIYTAVMFITKEEFNNVKRFIQNMKAHEAETKYAYANLVKMFIGKPTINNKRNVCSTFTACVLQMANPKLVHRDYSRMRPEDITIIPRSFYVMTFKDRDDFLAKKNEFKQRIKAIEETHIDEIKEYNNDLPKVMLKNQMDKDKTFDKIIDWFASKAADKIKYKKRV